MEQQPAFTNREDLYNYYDDYTAKRRRNLDQHDLESGRNLLKSYVLETAEHNGQPDIAGSLRHIQNLQLTPIGNDGLSHLAGQRGEIGYIEPLSSRYFVLHTLRDNTFADRTVQRLTEQAPKLDALWLSGEAFRQILDEYIVSLTPHRYVHLKAEFEPRFERNQPVAGFVEDEDKADLESDTEEEVDDEITEDATPAASAPPDFSALYRTAGRLSKHLSHYQEFDDSWRAIKMLRMPSNAYGGYDLYSWGKMTYRSPDFREGVGKLRFVAGMYERVTTAIESAVWLRSEPTQVGGSSFQQFRGLPVIFNFRNPLPLAAFEHFIDLTFRQRRGPFRLWGKPLPVGEGKVHVYGVDMHMWQQIYMELTLQRFLFVLPTGTCGNSIHRLMTNIQRFLDPAVTMTIAEQTYGNMVRNAIFEREVINV